MLGGKFIAQARQKDTDDLGTEWKPNFKLVGETYHHETMLDEVRSI